MGSRHRHRLCNQVLPRPRDDSRYSRCSAQALGQEPSLGLAARWAQRDGAGKPLADQYQAQGLEMLGVHAQFDDGSVEAGLADMLIRMESGRFKVFKHLTGWFDEYRLYHRKDGRVHKEGDDLMSATRYAVVMLALREDGYPTQAALDQIRSRRVDGGVTQIMMAAYLRSQPWTSAGGGAKRNGTGHDVSGSRGTRHTGASASHCFRERAGHSADTSAARGPCGFRARTD